MSGGTRSYEMAKRMVVAGHEVNMVTSFREKNDEHADWFTTNEAGIKVHWYPVPYSNDMSYSQRIKAFISFAYKAKKKAVSLSGDVVFATSTPLTIGLPAVMAARKLKIPMVFEVRDLWPEMPIAMGALKNRTLQRVAKRLENWTYQNSDAIVALSPGMKDGVVKTGYPSNKVAVIPNSSDNFEFTYNESDAEKFRTDRTWLGSRPLLVYAGTLGKVNGVDYIVKVAKELKNLNSNIRILLVGDGKEKNNIMKEAKDLGVFEQNVFFEAAMSKGDMPILFGAATMTSNLVIDLPEARANSANKFFDSLAASKPILINHGGWIYDLVKSHECGLAVWQQPVEVVAEQLHEKMNDKTWLAQAGLSARKLAEKEFDRDVLAAQLISILDLALQDKTDNVEIRAPGKYL
ncbi:glycosyltransferase family 4 protein [Psychrobacter sp. T6-5]|uniref:glycosyltransferase family 4 protein n=1 Tax=Psychrobacter sp. T6-5 TaxID=3457451 RepID=UPI003FD2F612